jgi:hypothetical protein
MVRCADRKDVSILRENDTEESAVVRSFKCPDPCIRGDCRYRDLGRCSGRRYRYGRFNRSLG